MAWVFLSASDDGKTRQNVATAVYLAHNRGSIVYVIETIRFLRRSTKSLRGTKSLYMAAGLPHILAIDSEERR